MLMNNEVFLFKLDKVNKVKLKNETVHEILVLDNKFSVALAEVSGENQAHYHKERTEVYHITKGSGKIIINGQVVNVEEGDTILIRPGLVHQILSENIRVLVICTPPFEKKDYHPVEQP